MKKQVLNTLILATDMWTKGTMFKISYQTNNQFDFSHGTKFKSN